MDKALEFVKNEKPDSLDMLSPKLDSFLLEVDNKNEVIKELIKIYKNKKKELEKSVKESRKTGYNPELYMSLKNTKRIIRYLSEKIDHVNEEIVKPPRKRTPSDKVNYKVKPKKTKAKTKKKEPLDPKILKIIDNIEQTDLNTLDVESINKLIKYYRQEKEKTINKKIAIKSKGSSEETTLANKRIKEYDKLIQQLTDVRNKKTVQDKCEDKKIKDRKLKLPISSEQLIELDKYFNINNLDLIDSIEDTNNVDDKAKIEVIYNNYINCKNYITEKLTDLVASKRKLQQNPKSNGELIKEINEVITSSNLYLSILDKLINYLKPFKKGILRNEDIQLKEENTMSLKQQDILEHMELELDIISNNIKDIVEAYKVFIRKENNITTHWNYILKITNLIIQKLSSMNPAEQKIYINMICDALKYQNAYIEKDNAEEKKKNKILQTMWKDTNVTDLGEMQLLPSNYKEQMKSIIDFFKIGKEEAYILWLRTVNEQLPSLTVEELEKAILDLVELKEEVHYKSFNEELRKVIINNMYVFENYFDIYMMHMEIPKDKKNILEALKKLIKNNEGVKEEDNKSYKLFHTIIFEEKDLSSLKRILSLEPRFINVKNYDGRYFLEGLLELYINQIMNDKYYFLENAFDIYFKYAGIYMDQDLKNKLVRQIKDTKESYKEEYNLDCILSNLLYKLDNIILLDTLKVEDEDVYTHKMNRPGYREFKNMLNRNIVTIDQNDTRFFENAISCDLLSNGTYQVGIYVSDVVDCLNQDLTIESSDLKHKEYKTNINRYKKYILKERKVKLAIAFTFILDEELEVLDFKIERARIRVKKNFTIDEATKILDEGDSEDKLFYILQRMNNVARKLYRKRNPKGHLKRYMDFIPEIQREFTYFVNRYVAALSEKENMPLIYKNQIPKNSRNLYELVEDIYSMSDRIEKIMEIATSDRVANYSTINRGNDLFDGGEYTQVTSPTRDLPSLLNQILIINNYIDNEYITEEQKQDLEKTLMLVNHYNNPKK